MGLHNIGEDIAVLRQRKTLNRLQRRERLQSEFRHVARIKLPVTGKGLLAVPHSPVMHIPVVLIIRLVKAALRRRRSAPIKGIRVDVSGDGRQQHLILLDVVRLKLQRGLVLPVPFVPGHFLFIVPAP
ncbi:hypothetical protein D3C75_798200 [compost metagenome]